jgi:hypothetical protein
VSGGGRVSAYDVSRVMRVVKHPNGELTRTPHDVALQLPIVPAVSGELRTYDILLPFLPPSKNEYDRLPGEWKSGVKRKWYRWVREECEAQDMPRNVPKIGLMAWLTFPNRGTVRDPQNYSSTLWNFVPDALQLSRGRGYPMLPDDGQGRIDFGPNLGIAFRFDERKTVPRKQRQRTLIRIAVRVP